jgi:molybdopterin-guanine dinucleotide biosynthesis protein A
MGGNDKAMMPLAGTTLLLRAAGRLRPQVSRLAVNGPFGDTALDDAPVIPDRIEGHQGPLAGIAAGLDWAQGLPATSHLATAACDTPFFPHDLVERLRQAASGGIAIARTAGRLHPTFALWPVTLASDLERHLASGGSRRLLDYAVRHGIIPVDFEAGRVDPFFNVNSPDDLVRARQIAREQDA